MSYRGRTKVDFDAGHRLLDYDGKCAFPHGHTYQAEILIETSNLDNIGLSIDFGDIKKPLKAWIDSNWDHAFLVNSDDKSLIGAMRRVPETKLFEFKHRNPSAEVMAETLFDVMHSKLGDSLSYVRIWEGLNSYAEYDNNERSMEEL